MMLRMPLTTSAVGDSQGDPEGSDDEWDASRAGCVNAGSVALGLAVDELRDAAADAALLHVHAAAARRLAVRVAQLHAAVLARAHRHVADLGRDASRAGGVNSVANPICSVNAALIATYAILLALDAAGSYSYFVNSVQSQWCSC